MLTGAIVGAIAGLIAVAVKAIFKKSDKPPAA